MMDKEIHNNFREFNEELQREIETNCVKAQLLKRVSKAMKNTNSIVEKQSPWFGSRIPEKLLPKNISAPIVLDVLLLPHEIYTHLVINSDGYVVAVERQKDQKEVPLFRADKVYAVRIRSGFFRRIGFTFWRSICD